MHIRPRNKFVKGNCFDQMEATYGMYLTLREILPRIDNTEANTDGVIGELPGESHSTVSILERAFANLLQSFASMSSGVSLLPQLRPMLWVRPGKETVAREKRTVRMTERRKIISLGGKPFMTVKMRVRVGSRHCS